MQHNAQFLKILTQIHKISRSQSPGNILIYLKHKILLTRCMFDLSILMRLTHVHIDCP